MRPLFTLSTVLLCICFSVSASAKWIKIESAEELTALYSDTTLSFTFQGNSAKGEYCAEGTGVFRGEPRKWWVKENDQICFEAKGNTICYEYFKHHKKKNKYLGEPVAGGTKIYIKKKSGRPASCDE